MAGFTTPDSVVFRVQALLQQYHATELALIDTRNNALSGAGSDNYFTTPTIAPDDFQRYVDRNTGKSARCVITDEGRLDEGQLQVMDFATSHAATMPRLDHKWQIGIHCIYSSSNAQNEGHDGGRLRANRLALAAHAVMCRYVCLDIPDAGTPLGALVASTYLIDFGRAREVAEDSVNHYAVRLAYGVRLIETRT